MPATGARNTPFSIIGGDVVITGNISASVDLHVDGKIEGDLSCASLVQGADSVINGCVTAQTARLAGLVDGSITAKDLIVERTARIIGDVAYENITIEQGGQIVGQFSHKGAPPAGELKLIASEG
ncbi:bactofilin family protein [Rhizorhapis sp. SPR117]|uniref:bactofilin family protein n=1 Tax=Rhizorhapis sp. SPR117 TaxID=2912611 RepID=UPI001F1747CB|nr:polymer-forming cytoskeletal protein [Rhizorhapis sp. SPR117]